MPKQEYPKYLFHATDETSPRLARTMDEHQALLAEGWAESPEEARGELRAHPPVDPNAPWVGDRPHKQPAFPVAKQEYPKYLFLHPAPVQDHPRLVRTEYEHTRLAAEGWRESPEEAYDVAQAPPAPLDLDEPVVTHTSDGPHALLPDGPTTIPLLPVGGTVPELPSTPPATPTPPTPLRLTDMNVTEAGLYIDTLLDLEQLAQVHQEEEQGKNRVGVKQAIDRRLNELAAGPGAPHE